MIGRNSFEKWENFLMSEKLGFDKNLPKVSVTIYKHEKTKLSDEDVNKFNAQYPILAVKYTRAFHDRFLILDEKIAYHIVASLKDAGKSAL